MFVNIVLSAVPTASIARIHATAIPDAIKPYSIAVAPDSSFKNLATKFCIYVLPDIISYIAESSFILLYYPATGLRTLIEY